MAKNLWWVTRPTRDLHDLPDALRRFAELARGKRWKGNRDLHQEFERTNPAKTPNYGRHGAAGSGGRTWAAWLKSWGMWYDDEEVKLTDGAELVLSAKDPALIHKQIVHQIMCFQQTSAYHESLGCEPGFRIFPFRFVMQLILDRRVQSLDLDEIGLFLLHVKTHGEYESVVRKILEWRKRAKTPESRKKLQKRLVLTHMKKYSSPRKDSSGTKEGYWRSIRDVANTIAVNISYVSEINYTKRPTALSVKDEDRPTLARLLAKYADMPFSERYEYSEAAFARRFGVRYDRRKASKKDTRPITPASKKLRRISDAISKLKERGDLNVGRGMVNQIAEITNYNADTISGVLKDHPELLPDAAGGVDREFAEYYMECAKSGDEYVEFENLTRRIFEKMGFKTRGKTKIPNDGEIDGLVLSPDAGLSGLLECKSGANYALTIGDHNKMSGSYIPYFKSKKFGGKSYALDFFVYVVGVRAGGTGNLENITDRTGVRGSLIYARDLLYLYALVKGERISPVAAWGLFKSCRHVTKVDIDDATS